MKCVHALLTAMLFTFVSLGFTRPAPIPLPVLGGRLVVTMPNNCVQGTVVQILDPQTQAVVATLQPNAIGIFDSGCVLPCPQKYIVRPVNPHCSFTPVQRLVGVRCCPTVTKVSFNCDCAEEGGRIVVQVPPNCVNGTTVQISELSGAPILSGAPDATGVFDTGCKLKCPTSYIVSVTNPNCTFTPGKQVVQVSCCPKMSVVKVDCSCKEPRGRLVVNVSPKCSSGTTQINVFDPSGVLVASGQPNSQGVFDTGCTLPCPAQYTVTATNSTCQAVPASQTVNVPCCPEYATVNINCDCPPPSGRIKVLMPLSCTSGTLVQILDPTGATVASGAPQIVQANGQVGGVFDTSCTLVCGQTYTVLVTNPDCTFPNSGQQVQAGCCPDATTVIVDCNCPPPPPPGGRIKVLMPSGCTSGTLVQILDPTGATVASGAPQIVQANGQVGGVFDTSCTLVCGQTYTVLVTNPDCTFPTSGQQVQAGCCPDATTVIVDCNCPPPPPSGGRIKVLMPLSCTSGTLVQILDPTGATVASGAPQIVQANGQVGGVFDTSCTLVCGQTYTVLVTNPDCTFPNSGQQVQAGCCPDATTVIVDCNCPVTSDCVTPPPGMVAWYTLDEQQGYTTVQDIAGTVQNAGWPSAPYPPQPTSGKVGGAFYFWGNGNYVEVPDNPELAFGSGSFTIDAWVRLVGCSQNHLYPIVEKIDPSASVGYSFYLVGDQLHLDVNGSSFASSVLGLLYDNTTWYHVAVTVDRSGSPTGTFWLNGTAVGTFTPPQTSVDNSQSLYIGRNYLVAGGQVQNCELTIDELELFNTALTQSQIALIYNADSAGKCRPSLGRIVGNSSPGFGNMQFTVLDASGNVVFVGGPGAQGGPGTFDTGCTLYCNQQYTVNAVNLAPTGQTSFPPQRINVPCCPQYATVYFP